MNIQSVSLGEVANIYSGFAFKSSDLVSSGIPVIKIANIQNKKVSPQCPAHFPRQLLLPKLKKYFLESTDTLIAMTGAGSVGRVGKMRKAAGRFLVNQRVAIVRPDQSKCDPEYIFQVLSQDFYEKKLYSLGFGAGQPNVSAKDIGLLDIPFPAINIQRKIASVLFSYDDLIENNIRRIKILEEMAQAIYREWFVNFRFPGHEKVKMVDSPLGKIPEGWEVKDLGDIAQETRRSIDPRSVDPETPYVGLEHLPRKSITLNDWGFAKDIQSTKLVFLQGEILFPNPPPKKTPQVHCLLKLII